MSEVSMCRFAAYLGPEIPLERIIVLPEHSLLEQSQNATEAKLAVNGDGFGIAWYAGDEQPGLYRDVLPAWSDGNLLDFCRMVKSRLFLAHVRASTVGETSRTNCHPFRHGAWTFMHNGQIGDFQKIQRGLISDLPDDLYHARRGSTDSEVFFLTLLKNGLDASPITAVQKTIAEIEEAQGTRTQPNRLSCAFSDGEKIFSFRYSSDKRSPSLYIGRNLDSGGSVLASERLEFSADRWHAVEEAEFVVIDGQSLETMPLFDR
jgi:glutamine amidotransferase